MELGKIINARKVLEEFAEKDDICARLAYWMAKFVAKTDSEQMFYATGIKKLFDKYAVARNGDVDASPCVPADKLDEFYAEINEFAKTEVEDPGIRFSLSELSTELKASVKQMYPLLDFIDEDV